MTHRTLDDPRALSARVLTSIVFAAAGLAGCGPRWTVVRQASPNPMNVRSAFYVEPLSFDGMRVGEKSESGWMAEKSADTREKWAGDKAAMNETLGDGFDSGRGKEIVRASAPAGAFVVRTRIDRYEPGYNAVVASSNGFVDATIDIVDPNGNVVDELVVHAEAGGMSAGERARKCARIVGWTTGKYVRQRIGLS